MKPLLPVAVHKTVLYVAMNAAVFAGEMPPGQVDFGTFSPPKDGEFVEVNVPSSLISIATRFVEKQEPDVAQMLQGLKYISVHVIGLDADNRAAIQAKADKVREDLAAKGWDRIVTAKQKNEDVGVFLKMSDKGNIQGLTAVVIDGEQHAVFVNVVGEIKPEQLATLGEKLHIAPLKGILEERGKHKAESEQ